MASLYIHVPFCKSRCSYCDFYKSTSCAKTAEYLQALLREMELRKEFFGSEKIGTIYFGGGTPSVLDPSSIGMIIDKASLLWDTGSVGEITIEVNPDDITPEYLEKLSRTGVNRISMGIQSFRDDDLRILGRRHTARQATEALEMMRDEGFENISVDLMFGIPGLDANRWRENLVKVIDLDVEHISVYNLSIEPGTPFDRMVGEGTITLPSDEVCAQQFMAAHDMLSSAGFDHYEISNYSKGPERVSRHNSNYWQGGLYLGLGPSAHSFDTEHRIFSSPSLEQYIERAGTPAIYNQETLSAADKYNEYVMLSLRTRHGVRRDVLSAKFGIQGLLYFEGIAEEMVRRGLLFKRDNSYRLPISRMMVSNEIISELFYLEEE